MFSRKDAEHGNLEKWQASLPKRSCSMKILKLVELLPQRSAIDFICKFKANEKGSKLKPELDQVRRIEQTQNCQEFMVGTVQNEGKKIDQNLLTWWYGCCSNCSAEFELFPPSLSKETSSAVGDLRQLPIVCETCPTKAERRRKTKAAEASFKDARINDYQARYL